MPLACTPIPAAAPHHQFTNPTLSTHTHLAAAGDGERVGHRNEPVLRGLPLPDEARRQLPLLLERVHHRHRLLAPDGAHEQRDAVRHLLQLLLQLRRGVPQLHRRVARRRLQLRERVEALVLPAAAARAARGALRRRPLRGGRPAARCVRGR